MKRLLLTTLATFILIFSLFGQWTNDPSTNTAISTLPGEDAIPKVASLPNGDTYVSFYANENGNYNIRLQKLNKYGVPYWNNNGILISDNPSMSWLTDWDMTVSQDSCAILVFQDIRTGNNDIFAYKISPNGDFVWGNDGLQLTDDVAFDASPKVEVTNSNNTIIAWSSENVTKIAKISPEGDLLFGGNEIILSEDDISISWPQILPVGDDDFILKYYRDSGQSWSPIRKLYAQRYDSDGNTIWENPTQINEAAGISAWTQILGMCSDGNQGFFITWHDDRDMNNISQVYLQHVLNDGSLGYAQDGIEVSTRPSRQRYISAISFNQENQKVSVFWRETNIDQNIDGIYAQQFDLEGNPQWDANDVQICPFGGNMFYLIGVQQSQNNIIVFYEESFPSSAINNMLKAKAINQDGEFVWSPEESTICSVESEKIHPNIGNLTQNQWVLAWEDRRNESTDIYAQNINISGELGNTVSPSGISGQITLNEGTANIQEANLVIAGTTYHPDETGNYSVELDPETYTVTCSLEGYEDFTQENVVVTAEEFTTLNIEMQIIVPNNDPSVNTITSLIGNYPNPFNPKTQISFNLRTSGLVSIKIYDIKGQRVNTLINDVLSAGNHAIVWTGLDSNNRKVSSGIYFYRMKSGNYTSTKKMILLK